MTFRLALVAAGGALGAVARYAVQSAVERAFGPAFPWGTLGVNVAGGLAMGLLAGWLAGRGEGGEAWRLALGVGVLGGFTTFSAFSVETIRLIEKRAIGEATVYVSASVALALAATALGLWIARRTFA